MKIFMYFLKMGFLMESSCCLDSQGYPECEDNSYSWSICLQHERNHSRTKINCLYSKWKSETKVYIIIPISNNSPIKNSNAQSLFATSWTVAHQVPLSMGLSRQEYWSGLPFPSSKNSKLLCIRCRPWNQRTDHKIPVFSTSSYLKDKN